MAPVKRHAYDAEFKLKAISHAVEHGNRAAAREFNINESMVRNWRKQEDDLRQVKKTTQSFRGNNARWPLLEDKIEQWVIEQRAAGRSVSTVSIRIKATALARDMNINDFRGGPSWCFRFMKRRNLSIRTRTTVSQQLPKDYEEKLATFTVVLGCQANGQKLPPMVIFKRKTLPKEKFPAGVIIKANPKGWMDEEKMSEWLREIYVETGWLFPQISVPIDLRLHARPPHRCCQKTSEAN